MDKLFHSKWKWFFISLLIVLLLVIIFFVTLFLVTESIRARPYPGEISSRWVSSDPYFVLEYIYVDGKYSGQNTVLEINGELQEVEVGYVAGTYNVYFIDSAGYTRILFGGSWRYREDKLVFRIRGDSVFDEAYKEIVFEPEAIAKENTGDGSANYD